MESQKRILITGANGLLGSSLVRYFLEKDPDCVVIAGVRQQKERIEELILAVPGRVRLVSLEVTSPESWQRGLAEVEAELGTINVLVNNAGFHEDGLLAQMPEEQWSRVVDVNLNAVFHGCKAVMKSMMLQRWGRIINIASLSALHGPAGQANYAAAKAGVLGLTQSLAKESARLGITVNAVCPGHIEGALPAGWPEEQIQATRKATPMRRFARPEEIAAVVFFLASREASYMTGAALKLDGGLV